MLPAPHRRNGHCRSRGMVQRLDCRIIKFLCRHCAAFSFCREVVKLAATRLIALHKNKGKSVAACLKSRTDYAQNPDKTQQGELVSSYECSPLTVDEEFMLSKRQYELATGRRQKSDVIAYQIRQSFKPERSLPRKPTRSVMSLPCGLPRVSMRLSLPLTRTGNTFTITLSTTPLRWTAPGNSGIFVVRADRAAIERFDLSGTPAVRH